MLILGESSTPEQAELVHNFLYSGGKPLNQIILFCFVLKKKNSKYSRITTPLPAILIPSDSKTSIKSDQCSACVMN